MIQSSALQRLTICTLGLRTAPENGGWITEHGDSLVFFQGTVVRTEGPKVTPPETDIAPENQWLEDEFPFGARPPERCYVEVSENRGTPKSSILIGFSIINDSFWGTPLFGNTHVSFGESTPLFAKKNRRQDSLNPTFHLKIPRKAFSGSRC